MKKKLSKIELKDIKKAQELAKNEDWHSALKILKRLSLENNESIPIHIILANIYWNINELENAIKHYKKATTLNPISERASLGLYHCYDDSGNSDSALKEMKRFMTLSDSGDYREILRNQ